MERIKKPLNLRDEQFSYGPIHSRDTSTNTRQVYHPQIEPPTRKLIANDDTFSHSSENDMGHNSRPHPPPKEKRYNHALTLAQPNLRKAELMRSEKTSTGVAQPPFTEHRRFQNFWDDTALDSWTWEFVSWFFAAGCVVAIVVILVKYDGQPIPNWPTGITLNSLIGVFSTLARAALTIPVSQGVSQLKWIWFTNREKKAIDLERFDEASRGPFGSIKFIVLPRLMSLASLGATVTVFALAASPLTQQAIRYVPTPIIHPGNEGSVNLRSVYFDAIDQIDFDVASTEDWNLDIAVEAAIFAGALTRANKTYPHLSPTCTTGNCTWPNFMVNNLEPNRFSGTRTEIWQTLGVCASTVDISDMLKIVSWNYQNVYKITVPDGPSLIYSTDQTRLRVAPAGVVPGSSGNTTGINTPNFKSLAFKNVLYNSVADFYVMWSEDGRNGVQFKAVEVNLQYCVQTLKSSVIRGKAHTEVVNWYTDFRHTGPHDAIGAQSYNTSVIKNWTARPPGSESFTIGYRTWIAMPQTMLQLFNGTFTIKVGGLNHGFKTPAIAGIMNAVYAPPYSTAGLSSMAENIAISMSNTIRSYNGTGSPSLGEATLIETHVRVSWPWLILIVALVLIGLAFLLLVIISTKHNQHELWKSSSLALLRSLDPYRRPPGFIGIVDNKSMQRHANEVTLTLEETRGLWKLS